MKLTILTFSICVTLGLSNSYSQTQELTNNKSVYATQYEYGSLLEDFKSLSDDIEILETLLSELEKNRQEIRQIEFYSQSVQSKMDELKKLGSELPKSTSNQLRYNDTRITEILDVYQDIGSLLNESLVAKRSIRILDNIVGDNRRIMRMLSLKDKITDQERPIIKSLEILDKFYDTRFENREAYVTQEHLNELKGAINELSNADLKNWFLWKKNQEESNFTYVIDLVNQELPKLKEQKDALNIKMRELDNALIEKQSVIDAKLINAVYFMIGALVVLFLGLYFFKPELASSIIEKRSLVEVISMAFMLLTIIILGTGGKIGNETIGTLLGTIAGYIFGRAMQQHTNTSTQ